MKEFIDKLIGRLEEERNEAENDYSISYDERFTYKYAMKTAIDIVNKLAEEYKGGWIPCSERLPKDETKKYIVQETDGFIDILGFTKDAYRLGKYDFYEYKGKKKALFYDWDSEYGYIERECVAWMPLPAPYTEGE